MNIGVIGLGRMGSSVAARLAHAHISVIGFDAYLHDIDLTIDGKNDNAHHVHRAHSIEELATTTRVVWLFVPAGKITSDVIENLCTQLQPGSIIIDGGNSNFHDSVRHYELCKQKNISFLDCGTSGGLHGRQLGFSLMVGGDEAPYRECIEYFKAVAASHGFGHVGPAGSGHYVKMIHNGIEYGMMQAYAEGLHLIAKGRYNDLDMAQITGIWEHGSIIRSWLLKLIHEIYSRSEPIEKIDGAIAEGGTGRWTVEEALSQQIPLDVIAKSLAIREASRATGGNYGTQLIQLVRHEFGGHPVRLKEECNEG